MMVKTSKTKRGEVLSSPQLLPDFLAIIYTAPTIPSKASLTARR